LFLFQELAFWTVAIVTTIVSLPGKPAIVAGIYVPAQFGSPAGDNVADCFSLRGTQARSFEVTVCAGIENPGYFNVLPFVCLYFHGCSIIR